ncbi:hypothetical protein Alg130_11057 [Pyrenophora tritici-repentis]|nr:hypothetical protein Alg130_11057 [Pyrenophora tritici-repentis]
MGMEIAEEARSAAEPPDGSVQEASNRASSAKDERRRPDHLSAPLTPSELMAYIEQAIDDLLKTVEDPYVQESLRDSIARIESKFKHLFDQVRKNEDAPAQRVERTVPSFQHHSQKVTAALEPPIPSAHP